MPSAYTFLQGYTREQLYSEVAYWPAVPATINSELQKLDTSTSAENLRAVVDLDNIGLRLSQICSGFIEKWEEFAHSAQAQLRDWQLPSYEEEVIHQTEGLFSGDQNALRSSMRFADEVQMRQVQARTNLDGALSLLKKAIDVDCEVLRGILRNPATKAWIRYYQGANENPGPNDTSDLSKLSSAANRAIYVAAEYLNVSEAILLDLQYLTFESNVYSGAIARFYSTLLINNATSPEEEWRKLTAHFHRFKRNWISAIKNRDTYNAHGADYLAGTDKCLAGTDNGRYGTGDWGNRKPGGPTDKFYLIELRKQVVQIVSRSYDQVLVGLNYLHYARNTTAVVDVAAEVEDGPLVLILAIPPKRDWTNFGCSYLPMFKQEPKEMPNILSVVLEVPNVMGAPVKEPMRTKTKTLQWNLPSVQVDSYRVVTWLTAINVDTRPNVRIKTQARAISSSEVEVQLDTWWDSETYSASIGVCLLPEATLRSSARCGTVRIGISNICWAKSFYVNFDPPFPADRAKDIRVMAAFSYLDLSYASDNVNQACIRMCTTDISDTGFYLHFSKTPGTTIYWVEATYIAVMQ